MNRQGTGAALLLMITALLQQGCRLPGKPKPGPEVPRPSALLSFEPLYGENCAGCHGKDGDNGPATNLRNPEYQAWVDDATLLDVTANGRPGSLMPAFALDRGGSLTSDQVRVIVQGMRSRWAKKGVLTGINMPAYRAVQPGDRTNGQAIYQVACARCHGLDAKHPGPAGSVLDGALLGLINQQTIRTTVVPGRPDIGQPDFRGDVPGQALTDAEVTDVAAWLIAQRPKNPGRPYPDTQPASARPGESHPQAERPASQADAKY